MDQNGTHEHDVEKGQRHAARKAWWARFRGQGRRRVGFVASLKAIAMYSCK